MHSFDSDVASSRHLDVTRAAAMSAFEDLSRTSESAALEVQLKIEELSAAVHWVSELTEAVELGEGMLQSTAADVEEAQRELDELQIFQVHSFRV